MLKPFKALKIGDRFAYNDKTYIKVETVWNAEHCCVPEYNAYEEANPDAKVLISSLKLVDKYE